MSADHGSSISIFTASDEPETTRTPRSRRAERRRERHDGRRQTRAAEQTPIRRLLRASV